MVKLGSVDFRSEISSVPPDVEFVFAGRWVVFGSCAKKTDLRSSRVLYFNTSSTNKGLKKTFQSYDPDAGNGDIRSPLSVDIVARHHTRK